VIQAALVENVGLDAQDEFLPVAGRDHRVAIQEIMQRHAAGRASQMPRLRRLDARRIWSLQSICVGAIAQSVSRNSRWWGILPSRGVHAFTAARSSSSWRTPFRARVDWCDDTRKFGAGPGTPVAMPLPAHVEGVVPMRFLIAALVAFQGGTQGPPAPDPFAFFRPTVQLSRADRENLALGHPVVHQTRRART
jgi:hypothetical protein